MKVSIIIPVYNVEPYIERCFDSVVAQSYNNKRIECLLIDDCSPDNSYGILEKNINAYQGEINFKIIRHSKNKGLSGARNTGIDNASGEYLYFLDSDDVIDDRCFEVMMSLVDKYPQVEIVQGNSSRIPKLENDWRELEGKGFPEYADKHLWIKKHCFKEPRITVNATNKLIRKDFIIENNLYFKEGIIHEDEHWTFFVAKHLSKIAFTTHYTYLQYVVPGSIMQSSANAEKSIRDNLIIIKDCVENIDSILPIEQQRFIFNYLRSNYNKALKGGYEDYALAYRNIATQLLANPSRNTKNTLGRLLLQTILWPKAMQKNILFRKMQGVILRLM
ncbi:MAG: glycosyltransferase family 2 protein [Bacteroidales bacterium]